MEEKMIHPETGETLYRDVRPIEYTYKEQRIIVNQPGWFPLNVNDDDGILSQEDMKVASEGLRIMKERHKKFLEEKNLALGKLSIA